MPIPNSIRDRSKYPEMAERIVLIDTDAGTDDAWGLFMALAAKRDLVPSLQIVGITTVCGNTTVENVANNVTRTLDTFGDSTTPIFKGMDSFMLSPFRFVQDPPFHGEDGFGDANLPQIPTRIEAEHSVHAIIRLAEMYQGRLSLVMFGPLTNLAIAVKIQPLLKEWLKEIYILGGNIEGVGNVVGVSNSAEYNFYVDPEAAQVVLQSFDTTQLFNMSWEVMLRNSSEHDFRTQTIGNMGTPITNLMNLAEATILEDNTESWLPCDAMLMACVINPSVITETEDWNCHVELVGSLTRGMMVLDRDPNSEKPKNVKIIKNFDKTLYEDMLLWAAGGSPPKILNPIKSK